MSSKKALSSRKSLVENDTDRDRDLQRSQIRLMEERILQLEQRIDALEDAMAEVNIHIAEGMSRLIWSARNFGPGPKFSGNIGPRGPKFPGKNCPNRE